MSQPPSRLSRRAFLGLSRSPPRAAAPVPVPVAPESPHPAFSLESFYAARAASGEATTDGRIPVFELRPPRTPGATS